MILVVDNYDSFTFNLVHLLLTHGAEVKVAQNDGIDLEEVVRLAPRGIILSPGPGRPERAGITAAVIAALGAQIPMLGVCLGHQAIAQAFGGSIVRARAPRHGRTSRVHHDGAGVFAGLESPFTVMRYHSLAVERASLPTCLELSAWTEEGEVMGVRHRDLPLEGVQFHPESFLSQGGDHIVKSFLKRAGPRGARPVIPVAAEG